MKKTSATSHRAPAFIAPTHEQISRRAEELWKNQGCPNDHDDEIWLEAERQLQPGAAAPVPPSPSTGARRPAPRGNSASAGVS